MQRLEPTTNKSLGQHWLRDEPTLQAICRAADLQTTDVVLEIGPGLGTLTNYLVKLSSQVIAVELDEALARKLADRLQVSNLEIKHQDILRFDFTQLPSKYKVVANIPYYLTSNLIRILSETPNPPTMAVLLIQKEVAERLSAKPGNMSILAVTAQFYWQVDLGQFVPAELFTPPPKVDSQIVILRRRRQLLFDDVDTKQYFRLVRAGFSQKRKKLINALSGGLAIKKDETETMLAMAEIMPIVRAQTLSLEDWYRLYQAQARIPHNSKNMI